jgi:hypothetical protein
MRPKEQHADERYKSPFDPPDRGADDASRIILLGEYHSLLNAIEPVRIANRVLVLLLVALQVIHDQFSPIQTVTLLVITAAASCGWSLQEARLRRRLRRLGKLIATTNAGLTSEARMEAARPVILPTTKKQNASEASGTSDTDAVSNTEDEVRPARTPEHAWTDTYINWCLQPQKDGLRDAVDRIEPFIWLGVVVIFRMFPLLLHVNLNYKR